MPPSAKRGTRAHDSAVGVRENAISCAAISLAEGAAVAAEQTELDLFRPEGSPRGLADAVAPDSAAPLRGVVESGDPVLRRSESPRFLLFFDAGEVLSPGGVLLSSKFEDGGGKVELTSLVALNLTIHNNKRLHNVRGGWGVGVGRDICMYSGMTRSHRA